MHFHELLTEMIWEDRFEAAKAARRFPNAWIHFAGRPAYGKDDPEPVYKLGINPMKGGRIVNGASIEAGHHDPPGIYFYPVKFLFGDEASLSQYATEYRYYYIVRFKRSANIINLGRVTMDAVEQIATANGWIDDLREIMQHPEILTNAPIRHLEKPLLRRPGGVLYATMDYLANVKHRPWLGLLKGYHGLIDPGRGFISGGEVAQAVIFGRQHIEVLAQGENVDQGDREYAGILKQVAEQLNGRFYYKNKVPIADFDNDGRPFQVKLKLGWYIVEVSYYSNGFWLTEQINHSTNAGDRQHHYESILGYARSAAQKAGPAGARLHWNGETATALMHMIRPGARTNQRVEEDGLHVWQQLDSFGGTYSGLRAIISHDDHILVEARLSIGDTIECNVSLRFGPQEMATVAAAVLDALAEQLLTKVRNPAALKKGSKIGGFAWGDRFSAV